MLLKKLGSRVLDLIFPVIVLIIACVTASAVMAVRRRRSAGSTPGWNCW